VKDRLLPNRESLTRKLPEDPASETERFDHREAYLMMIQHWTHLLREHDATCKDPSELTAIARYQQSKRDNDLNLLTATDHARFILHRVLKFK
jgi:hypothetical protein